MKRNCPHCGQEQVIADEEIVAPWVFTRCHSCENLSIVKGEGATRSAGASSKSRTPRIARKTTAILRKSAPATASVVARRASSEVDRTVRPEAVMGAFASAAGSRDSSSPSDDEREWKLPTYFSPFAADSEQVTVLKIPPATPTFLRKKKPERERELEPVLEPLAQAIRDELPVSASPVSASGSAEASPGSASANSVPASSAPSGSAPASSAPAGGSKRRQRLLGTGVLFIGIGLGLLALKAHQLDHLTPPDPPTEAPPPSTVTRVESAQVSAPAPAPVAPSVPVPVLSTPGPAEILAAPDVVAASAVKRVPSGFWVVRVTGNSSSLRAGPGKQFKSLGELKAGTRWKVRKWDGEWFQVEPENMGPETLGIGWIRNDLVKPEGNGGSE